MPGVNRQSVDLSGFPDLVVIYLGMRVNRPRGLRTLAWIGPRIRRSVLERPDGLLLHEDLIFSLFPPHLGMRQYWRDFDAMERWARSLPHKQWWQRFVRDTGGTGFWHQTYLMRGGMEAIYDNVDRPLGLMRVAPLQPARGRSNTARTRAGLGGDAAAVVPVADDELPDGARVDHPGRARGHEHGDDVGPGPVMRPVRGTGVV
jgi:Domain of unknown function (DUF4188)